MPPHRAPSRSRRAVPLPEPLTWDGLLRYAFLCERQTWERMLARRSPLAAARVDRPALPGGEPYWGAHRRGSIRSPRALRQMDEMIERLAAKGLDVAAERQQLAELRRRAGGAGPQEIARRRGRRSDSTSTPGWPSGG